MPTKTAKASAFLTIPEALQVCNDAGLAIGDDLFRSKLAPPAKAGKESIPCVRLGHRTVRIARPALMAWIKRTMKP